MGFLDSKFLGLRKSPQQFVQRPAQTQVPAQEVHSFLE